MKIFFIVLFLVLSIGFTIWGRFVHFHSTEMEALFYGWKYWAASFIFGLIAMYLAHKE